MPIGFQTVASRKVVNMTNIEMLAIRCCCTRQNRLWSHRLPDPSRSRANRNRHDLVIDGPRSPLITSPIVNIPTYHPIQASRQHNAYIIWVVDAFEKRKASDIDRINTNAGSNTDRDASPISYRRRRSRPTPKRPSARSRRPRNTAGAPFESHASNTPYNIQSHIIPTHFIQSIHLGPCID